MTGSFRQAAGELFVSQPAISKQIKDLEDKLGRPHNIALWGGTGLLPDVNIYQYLMSLDKFTKVCDEYNVEGAISNHPGRDNGIVPPRKPRN